MKKILERITIVFGAVIVVLSGNIMFKMLISGVMWHMGSLAVGGFIVGTFLSLGLLLKGEHQFIINAFILTTLTLFFSACMGDVSDAIQWLLLFAEAVLGLYIFLLIFGDRLMDMFVEATAVRDEVGNMVRVEPEEGERVVYIGVEVEKKLAFSFMTGASVTLILFEIAHLLTYIIWLTMLWTIGGTLLVSNLVNALWREPSSKK